MADQKEYKKESICAVVVSYNPDAVLEDNVNALTGQVGKCVIVDNGSTDDSILKKVEKDNPEIEVIRLGANKGIAKALNVGLDYCVENRYPLLLTMDQDTVLHDDAVEALLYAMKKHDSASVGINWDGRAKEDESAETLISSGNLLDVDTAIRAGGFNDKLFIDSVDFDLSLRIKDLGSSLIKVAGAKATHNLGEKTESALFSTHSPQRYYYITRNHFYINKKFGKTHRLFCLKKNVSLAAEIFKVLLFDAERKEKIRMMKKGYKDYRSWKKDGFTY